MKQSFLLNYVEHLGPYSGVWTIGDKPSQSKYDGFVHVLEDGVWDVEVYEEPPRPLFAWVSGPPITRTRQGLAAAGTTAAALCFGGKASSNYSAATEIYNGMSWSSSAFMNISVAREGLAGCGTAEAAHCFGGWGDRIQTIARDTTEVWGNDSWWAAPNMLQARYWLAAAGGSGYDGKMDSGILSFGGYEGTRRETEHYDYISWTVAGNMSTGRYRHAGCGTAIAALAYGGTVSSGNGASAESYNGVSWSTESDMPGSSRYISGCGTSISALAFLGDGQLSGETAYYDGLSWSLEARTLKSTEMAAGCGTSTSALYMGGKVGGWDMAEYTEVDMKTTGPSRMVNPSGGNSNEQNTQ